MPKVRAVRGNLAILGRATLQEIRNDIQRMSLPSWIGRLPTNLGSASHGSLSADQWRTAATVNLVTSLVRLWGSKSNDTRHKEMLDNFIDLVSAIKVANMRVMTAERVQEYESSMTRYLQGIVRLYPKNSLVPYHHMSLHFTRFLEDFGPTHSWRCFPFERYNHLLQQVSTNKKYGESIPQR
jgi:hypothetical protein